MALEVQDWTVGPCYSPPIGLPSTEEADLGDPRYATACGSVGTLDTDRPMSLPLTAMLLSIQGRPSNSEAMPVSPFSALPGWQFAAEPSFDEFEAIAAKAFRQLPRKFRALCEDLVIRVEDFPTDDVVHRMEAKSKFQILGLFQGVGLPFRFESAPVRMPNMIWLYRRPILAYWTGHQDTLDAIIAHVLVHEIGHHFGFSDDDMHGIEHRAD